MNHMRGTAQHTPEPSTSGPSLAIKVGLALSFVLFLVMTTWLVIDYKTSKIKIKKETLPEFAPSHTFTLGDPDLYFMWFDHNNTQKSARTLTHIPSWTYPALEVWTPAWGPRPVAEGGYLVDLSTPIQGQQYTATLVPRNTIFHTSHAADAGNAHGILTTFFAQELANLNPSSDRTKNTIKLQENLGFIEENRPLTTQEIIQIIRATEREKQRSTSP